MNLGNLHASLKRFNFFFMSSSILMVVVGVLAIVLPLAAGIGVSIFVSWLIFLTGFAHLVYAFAARGVGGFAWRLVVGIVYVAGGLYLAFHPRLSLVSLTLVLAAILTVEGVMQVAVFIHLRSLPGSGWILFDGAVTLLLGLLIGLSWPSGSAWAIGTLVGINFLVSGFARLVYGASVNRAVGVLNL